MIEAPHQSKTKLLDAALQVVRAKGYTATTVDDICAAAGVTKGSFFHHFKSKEELAIAAAGRWSEVTDQVFAVAPYQHLADPLARVLAYVDFRKAMLQGELPQYTCFAGTTVQEVYDTHPAIRDACADCMTLHAATFDADIAAAMAQHGVTGAGTAKELSLHIQAVIQGAYVVAKATQNKKAAESSLDHLRRYLELLFRSGDEIQGIDRVQPQTPRRG